MYNIGSFMHDYPSTTLFGQVFKTILCIHVLFSKVAVLILKASVIYCKQLAKYLAFYLLYEISEGIAIDEASFLGIMRM